jgi:hypothetical protein
MIHFIMNLDNLLISYYTILLKQCMNNNLVPIPQKRYKNTQRYFDDNEELWY